EFQHHEQLSNMVRGSIDDVINDIRRTTGQSVTVTADDYYRLLDLRKQESSLSGDRLEELQNLEDRFLDIQRHYADKLATLGPVHPSVSPEFNIPESSLAELNTDPEQFGISEQDIVKVLEARQRPLSPGERARVEKTYEAWKNDQLPGREY